jgi:hypothetical protein
VTLLSALITDTRRHLYSQVRDEVNRLTAGIDADDTALTFDFDLGAIQRGAILSAGLEEMLVWSVSSSGAVVERGYNGTTAAAHSAGAAVRVNAKYTDAAIVRAMNDDLRDLSSQGLYRVDTVSVTFNAGTDAYDLTSVTDLLGIIEVRYDVNDGTERWMPLGQNQWRLRRGMPTADFPSGMSLTINGYPVPGQALNILYKLPFAAALSTYADVVETVTGLPVSAHDLLPLGAALRLTIGSEISRNFMDQGETRRADEVPPGSRGSSMRGLIAWRQQRISNEAARLYRQYPTVRS